MNIICFITHFLIPFRRDYFLTPSTLGEGREGGYSQKIDDFNLVSINSGFQKLTCIFDGSLCNLAPAQQSGNLHNSFFM